MSVEIGPERFLIAVAIGDEPNLSFNPFYSFYWPAAPTASGTCPGRDR